MTSRVWHRRLGGIAALALALAPAAGADDFAKSVPAEPGGELRVRLDGGSVELESHDERRVRVDARHLGWGSGELDLDVKSDGTDVRIDGRGKGWIGRLLSGGTLRLRVRVPERYSVDVRTGGGSIALEELEGSVKLRTSGGSVELDQVRGDVDVETSGGSIEGDEIEGDVKARTSGGRIDLQEVAGEVRVRTSGGPIHVHEVVGPVDARTSGGPISVRFTGAPEGSIETSGGGIEVEFPDDVGVNLDAKTSGGSVEIDDEFQVRGRVDRERVAAEINGGGRRLTIRTSGGGIRIRAD